jgi:hypothetical protein
VGVEREHADPQDAGDALAGELGAFHAVLQPGIQRPEVVPELPPDLCQPNRAVVALEQRSADLPFLLLDRLGDASGRQAQPGGGPAEMQLLGQCQEDLDVPQFHA